MESDSLDAAGAYISHALSNAGASLSLKRLAQDLSLPLPLAQESNSLSPSEMSLEMRDWGQGAGAGGGEGRDRWAVDGEREGGRGQLGGTRQGRRPRGQAGGVGERGRRVPLRRLQGPRTRPPAPRSSPLGCCETYIGFEDVTSLLLGDKGTKTPAAIKNNAG